MEIPNTPLKVLRANESQLLEHQIFFGLWYEELPWGGFTSVIAACISWILVQNWHIGLLRNPLWINTPFFIELRMKFRVMEAYHRVDCSPGAIERTFYPCVAGTDSFSGEMKTRFSGRRS